MILQEFRKSTAEVICLCSAVSEPLLGRFAGGVDGGGCDLTAGGWNHLELHLGAYKWLLCVVSPCRLVGLPHSMAA